MVIEDRECRVSGCARTVRHRGGKHSAVTSLCQHPSGRPCQNAPQILGSSQLFHSQVSHWCGVRCQLHRDTSALSTKHIPTTNSSAPLWHSSRPTDEALVRIQNEAWHGLDPRHADPSGDTFHPSTLRRVDALADGGAVHLIPFLVLTGCSSHGLSVDFS